MTLTGKFQVVNGLTIMGADDERIMARINDDGHMEIAYWAMDLIKLVIIDGPKSVCDVASYDAIVEEFGDSFEIAFGVDGGTIIAIDSCNEIITNAPDCMVVDALELDSEDIYEYEELQIAFGI